MDIIDSENKLVEIVGNANPLASKKIYDYLNPRMEGFIKKSPLVFLSSVDEFGFPTISPKGDKAGFVKIAEGNAILLPELRGNKLVFSLKNIISSNNKVGLIFIVPNTMKTLRVHGECEIIQGDQICKEVSGFTHNAIVVLKIKISKAYFHCGKAFLRSAIWDHSTYEDPIKVSFGKEIAENTIDQKVLIDEFDQGVKLRYQTDL